MRLKKENIDLTKGVIWKGLIVFLLPILAGNLFQQLYTTVDAVIIGQFTGKAGLAAIDSVYNLLKLPVNFFTGLSTGATIIISQYFGARKKNDLSKAVHTAVGFSFVGGAILSIIGVAGAPSFISMLDVPDEIYDKTLSYVRIYFSGLSVSMVYNIGAGILRAMGDSKTPFYYLIAASTVNVVLDFLFIGLLDLGVTGAAIATVTSQLVSAILVIRALIKTDMDCKLFIKKIRFHHSLLKKIISIGLPIGLQSSLFPISNMMIQGSINRLGTDSIAAWALCGKLDFLIWIVVDSLSAAISTFSAQNFGAKQYSRLRRGVMSGLGMAIGIILVISTVLYFWSEPIGKLFIKSQDFDIIPFTGKLMRFLSPLYFIYVFGEVFSGAIRGTGKTMKPMIITLLCTCLSRALWILFVVPHNTTMITIIWSYPVSWLLTSISFSIYYAVYKKKLYT